MNIKFMLSIVAAAALLFVSCDDTTDTVGISLIDDADQIQVTSNVFYATSHSVSVDSVVSRSATCYLGRVLDPETGSHITCDFMTQFYCLEGYKLVDRDSVASLDETGQVNADSCEVRLFYNSYYGDSLATMKLTAYEMDRPMKETTYYYSDFDPMESGLIRQDGIQKEKVYALIDNSDPNSRKESDDEYVGNICIRLNDPYTDKDGVTYNNFGTFVMRQYYAHPEYFKNSISFINHILPGMFFKMTGGLGSMAYVAVPQMNIYYRQYTNNKDSLASKVTLFSGTEEVLQTTTVNNDQQAIHQLVNDNSCTYIKSPSGIFTEVTLPVDEIMKGHEKDSINMAKIKFNRINNEQSNIYNLPAPKSLLMVETDSVASFFEKGKIANYKSSHLAVYNTAQNSYSFNNICELITAMYQAKTNGLKSDPNWVSKHPNWNKVMLVPVTTNYTSYNQTSILVNVSNDMSLTSTRLVGGDTPISISVIYSTFD